MNKVGALPSKKAKFSSRVQRDNHSVIERTTTCFHTTEVYICHPVLGRSYKVLQRK